MLEEKTMLKAESPIVKDFAMPICQYICNEKTCDYVCSNQCV